MTNYNFLQKHDNNNYEKYNVLFFSFLNLSSSCTAFINFHWIQQLPVFCKIIENNNNMLARQKGGYLRKYLLIQTTFFNKKKT
jgi:hypothetical protein